MEQLLNANTSSPQYGTNEPVVIADEDIGNSSIFKEFIFKSIYRGYKVDDVPVTTIAQAKSVNTTIIFVGTTLFLAGIFIISEFIGAPIGFPFMILLFPFIGTIALFKGITNMLQLGFYKQLLSYFDSKAETFRIAQEFEKKASRDIMDNMVSPIQVEEISMLIKKLTELSGCLDGFIVKLDKSSSYFNGTTYSTIHTFLGREIVGFRRFFAYMLTVIQKWNEGHKNELNTVYQQIQSQIDEVQRERPDLAQHLILTTNRLENHIESTGKILTRV